jgi:fibronectin-binding autotransporter adhesin
MIYAPANRVRLSNHRAGTALRATVYAIVATLIPSAGHAQSTWLPTSGTFSWLSSGSWSNSTVPNATGAVAAFTTGGVTVSIPTATVTTGTIRTTNASGNVIIGDTATTTDILNLDVASGVPTIDVGTGGQLFMYANVTGSQGFTKTGAGTLTFRFNPHNMAYTGTVTLNQGTLGLNQDGSLGDTNNPLSVTGNSTLLIAPGSNSGTVAFAAGRTMTIASSVTSTVQNNNAAQTAVFNNPISGSGALVLNTGTFTLNGNNTYAGNTTLTNVNRLTLGSGSRISSAGLTLASGSTATFGTTVDLGGNAQSVSSLAITTGSTPVTTTFTNGSLNVTGGSVNLTSGFAGATPSGTASVNMSGLSSLTYNNAAGSFKINPISTTASGTVNVTVNFANAGSGLTTITAGTFQVGGAPNNFGAWSSTVGLGKSNTVSTAEFTLGGFNGSGTASFQSAGSVLTVRGTGAADTRTGLMAVGWTSSGVRQGDGSLNLSNGAVDARLTSLVIGRHGANANNAVTGSLILASGTLDVLSMSLGEKTATSGSSTSLATLTQSGGLVQSGTIYIGNILATTNATPAFTATYSLSSGTLAAGSITSQSSVAGAVASTAASTRRIAWSGGTITNLDGTTDLLVSGTDTNAGYVMQVVLSGTGAKVLAPTGGRSITFDQNTAVSSTGSLTVNGAGTVVINGSNSYSGGTILSAGTLRAGSANAFGVGAISIAGGASLDLNALAIANAITNNGGTVSNAGSYAGAQTLSGSSSFGNLGGTVTVDNGGVATFTGAMSGGVTVNTGGVANVASGGSVAGGVSLAGGSLGGAGTVGTISGAGLVGPGNSPGILTGTGSLDPTGGVDFAFEFTGAVPTWSTGTASVNDVLRLTAATPIAQALTSGNVINVYLNAGSLSAGNTFLGGLFIDQPQGSVDLAPLVAGATFAYFVAGGSDVTYNGVGYSTFANYVAANPAITGITPSTVTVASADFAGGTVTNGQTLQFAIVPEPGALALVVTGALAAGWAAARRHRRR